MNRSLILFLVIIVFISILGCSTSRKIASIPDPGPLVNNYQIVPAVNDREYEKEIISSKQDTLTISEAIQLVLLKNPELLSHSIEIRAQEARTLQESFAPNPEIEFEVENFAGSKEFTGFNGSEITLSVGQLIELAGKRNKRTRAAVLQSDLSAWDYEAKKLDILTETVKQYLNLIGSQEQIVLNEELVAVSERLHQAVKRLVQGGKISAAEISRTQILLSSAQLELNRSRRELETDRFRLSSLWGETSPRFKFVTGSLETVSMMPPVDSLKKFLSENPDIIRWAIEIEMRKAIEVLEKAKQIPDPTIQAGYRHLSGPKLNAFVANLSIPIPIFDNNKGAVQEAFNRRKKAQELQRQAEIVLSTNLMELYQNLQVLYTDIENSIQTIIPEAEKAYQIINDGYLSGKFNFLDVLESQRTLYETRKNLIASLIDYNILVAEIEKLIGRPLATVIK